ncbi:MAG: beta-phosphoglucomutase [Spirochaetia bacterium]
MADIKAFIFDLDGVITDTAEFHFKAWKRMADEDGIPFTRQDNEALRGVSRAESLRRLLKGKEVTPEKFQEMMDRKNSYYREFLKTMTPDDLLPGAKELVLDLKKRGIKTAIGSSSKNAQTVLEGLEVTDMFEAVADGDSVENAKPAPDLFLHAAELMNLAPETCVVVEDAESGVEAALAGNFVAVGIGPEERVGKAHFRYDSTKDINVDEIVG